MQCRLWGKLIGCFFMTIDLEHRGGKSVELDQTINLRVGIGIIQPSVEQSTISRMNSKDEFRQGTNITMRPIRGLGV